MRDTHRARLETTLRQLAAVGSMVDFSVAKIPEENAEVEIHLVGGIHDSLVCELPDGRAGYILDLEIVNQTSKTIHCSQTELRMPWQDAFFNWLPDPKHTGRSFSYFRRKRNGRCERVDAVSASYCFSGGGSLEYPRNLVLNHILLQGCALLPRCPLKGLLLATGGPMPSDLRHGQWLRPTLAIISSSGVEYTASIFLWTERLAAKSKFATRGKSNLFDQPLKRAETVDCNQPLMQESEGPRPRPVRTLPSTI
jgi:hypothetical protein